MFLLTCALSWAVEFNVDLLSKVEFGVDVLTAQQAVSDMGCSSERRNYDDPRAMEWGLGLLLPMNNRLGLDLNLFKNVKDSKHVYVRSKCDGVTYTMIFEHDQLHMILLSISHSDIWNQESPFEQSKVASYRNLQKSFKGQCLRVFKFENHWSAERCRIVKGKSHRTDWEFRATEEWALLILFS